MKTFHFPLEKALAWRRTQLDVERAELRRLAATVAAIDRSRAVIEAQRVEAEIQVRESTTLDGIDLEALGRFRLYVRAQDKKLAQERVAAEHKLGEQRAVMLEARRRCRLLELLKEKRLTEWTEAAGRELEAFAAEAYLAKWPARIGR